MHIQVLVLVICDDFVNVQPCLVFGTHPACRLLLPPPTPFTPLPTTGLPGHGCHIRCHRQVRHRRPHQHLTCNHTQASALYQLHGDTHLPVCSPQRLCLCNPPPPGCLSTQYIPHPHTPTTDSPLLCLPRLCLPPPSHL